MFKIKNQVGEKYILLYENKVCLFINIKIDKLFWKYGNIILLKIQKCFSKDINITFYNNCYFFIFNYEISLYLLNTKWKMKLF